MLRKIVSWMCRYPWTVLCISLGVYTLLKGSIQHIIVAGFIFIAGWFFALKN